MNDLKRKEFTDYLDAQIVLCKNRVQELGSDGREDEAVFVKIKLNVYDIFKSVFNTLGAGDKFVAKLSAIPAAWQVSLEKAEAHGDAKKAHIEQIKLDTVKEIEAKFKEILEA